MNCLLMMIALLIYWSFFYFGHIVAQYRKFGSSIYFYGRIILQ